VFINGDPGKPDVLPILSETAVAYGVDKVEIARASIIGQPIHMLSPNKCVDGTSGLNI
jgi:CitMHS family citrate-Mg2+:H+ or citrate-Ca2+:H+ symporter